MKFSRALIDMRPLRRYPDFGRLWLGQSISGFGGQLTVYAVILQAFQMSGAPSPSAASSTRSTAG